AANVERHLVVEETKATANDRSIIFEWRPGKAGTRSEILFLRDLLILVTQAEIETQIGKHHPPVLRKSHVFTIVDLNPGCRSERDSLRQRRGSAGNVHWTRGEVHLIADAVKIEANLDVMRAEEKIFFRELVYRKELQTPRASVLCREVVSPFNRRRECLLARSLPPHVGVESLE